MSENHINLLGLVIFMFVMIGCFGNDMEKINDDPNWEWNEIDSESDDSYGSKDTGYDSDDISSSTRKAEDVESGILSENEWLHRYVDVSTNAEILDVLLTVNTGLVEMMLKYEVEPDEAMYLADGEDCYDWADIELNGHCQIMYPTEGRWHIALWAKYDSSFTLATTVTESTIDDDPDPIPEQGYELGIPASTSGTSLAVDGEADFAESIELSLEDGVTADLPGIAGTYSVLLESKSLSESSSMQKTVTGFQTETALVPSGTVKQLTVTGTGDPTGLTPVITFLAKSAGTVNPATLNVLRIGSLYVDGAVENTSAVLLPVSVASDGKISFTDGFMAGGVQQLTSSSKTTNGNSVIDENYHSTPAFMPMSAEWEASAQYILMTFQDDLNWNRSPVLVRMIPDPANAVSGYRHPASDAELATLAKTPICNFVLLVHGHNEEEKGGSSVVTTTEPPWLFSYKRLVWEQFYQEITRTEESEGRKIPVYPYECTAFYEFIYPTYRPIFSEVIDGTGARHETLGAALGVAIQQELVNNAQLKAMIQNNMMFNAIIVAHSQGGLVARAGLRDMPQEFKDRTVRYISWGTPHHGAPLYTLRYAFQAGYDMMIDSKYLPLIGRTAMWYWGPEYTETLNAYVALDTPGIRDLRWNASLKEMLDIGSLFPAFNDDTQFSIPLYSQNLAVFNQDIGRESIAGGFTFLTGITSKKVDLGFNNAAEAWYFVSGSTSIEQGALLNSYLMKDENEKVSDGAVPLFSQEARNIAFDASVKTINLGDVDHEEFYGAEPAQRTDLALERGRAASVATFNESGLSLASRGCPTINNPSIIHVESEAHITGSVEFPLYDISNGGDNELGSRIEKVELRYDDQEGIVIDSVVFEHDESGVFEGICPSSALEEKKKVIVAVLKDGSEIVTELPEITVTITAPRIVIFELQGGATEASHTFEAVARPDGTYTFEWNFGDGTAPMTQTVASGQISTISHVYVALKGNESFYPSVSLYDKDGKFVATDSISIKVEKALTPIADFDCGWEMDLTSLNWTESWAQGEYQTAEGLKHGPSFQWYDNDRTQLKKVTCYYENQLHGNYMDWDEDGILRSKNWYLNNEPDGLQLGMMWDMEWYCSWSEYANGAEIRWGQYPGDCLWDEPAENQPGETYPILPPYSD